MPPRRPPLSLECVEGRVLPSAGPVAARVPDGPQQVRVGSANSSEGGRDGRPDRADNGPRGAAVNGAAVEAQTIPARLAVAVAATPAAGLRVAPPEPADRPAGALAEPAPEPRPPAAPPPPDRTPAPATPPPPAGVRFEPAGMPPVGDLAAPSPAVVPADPPADPDDPPFDFRPVPALPAVPFPPGLPLAGVLPFDTLRDGAADLLAGLPEWEVGGPLVETAAWATAAVLVAGGAASGWAGLRRARRRTLAAVAALRGEETRAR